MPALTRSCLVFFSFAYSDCCIMVFIHIFESGLKFYFCIAIDKRKFTSQPNFKKSHNFPTYFGKCHSHCPISFGV